MSSTIADGKIIFNMALTFQASSIIISHNHPSGNLNPSSQDLKLTKSLTEFGKYIDLPLLDHIIFTDNGYFSFAEQSLL
jgi:DNA repair protein RadC